MKIAFLGSNKKRFNLVFSEEIINELKLYGELSTEIINKSNIREHGEFLSDCEIAFSTWGMPVFTVEEIKQFMPNLKCLFYAAGSVQNFAKPFFDCGVRIFSAYAANAEPVIEYTFSQIILASKGFYQGAKRYRLALPFSFLHTRRSKGNFRIKVGIIGLGTIGAGVAEKLKETDIDVLGFDPFCSKEKAENLGVILTDLETIFRDCAVISNHLADKKELRNIFSGKLFKLMQKHSTFINTGRGEQVNECALAKSLLLHPSRTAVLDVLKIEYFPYINPLFWCPNAVITPHIAGSLGNETERMAYFMIKEFENYINGSETKYEITENMLSTIA